MNKPKAPKPLDPNKVAGAQLTANKDSIQQQAAANRIDQTDAFGNSLKYTQTGPDAQGNPTYAANQSMGAQGQAYAGGLFDLGQQYFNTAGQGAPDDMAGFTKAQEMYDQSQAPYLARQDEALDSKLRNQGLDPSSQAYKNSTMDLRRSQGEARNNFVGNAQNQFFNQGMQGRQQQLNELAPGVNASQQFMNPSYVNTPGVNVPVSDMNSLYAQQQQGLQNNYNQKLASYNGMLGGLASIGGSLAMAPMTGGGSLFGTMAGKAFA